MRNAIQFVQKNAEATSLVTLFLATVDVFATRITFEMDQIASWKRTVQKSFLNK